MNTNQSAVLTESQLRDFACDLVVALGDGWSIPPRDGDLWIHALNHRDGYGLYMRRDKYISRKWDKEVGKTVYLDDWEIQTIEISGTWPRDKHGNVNHPYGEKHSICCNPKRGAGAVAKDIERRLMPGYLEAYRKMAGQAQRHDQEREGRKALAERVAALSRDGQVKDRGDGYSWFVWGFGHCNIEVTGDIKLEARVGFEEARVMLEALLKYRRENGVRKTLCRTCAHEVSDHDAESGGCGRYRCACECVEPMEEYTLTKAA